MSASTTAVPNRPSNLFARAPFVVAAIFAALMVSLSLGAASARAATGTVEVGSCEPTTPFPTSSALSDGQHWATQFTAAAGGQLDSIEVVVTRQGTPSEPVNVALSTYDSSTSSFTPLVEKSVPAASF